METELTPQERYQLLNKLTEAVGVVTQELEATKNKLTTISENHEKLQLDIHSSVAAIKYQVDQYKEETDRFQHYSKGIAQNLEDKFTNFNEKFDNFNRILDILNREVKSIQEKIQHLPTSETIRDRFDNVNRTLGILEQEIARINEKIKELPTLETIRQIIDKESQTINEKIKELPTLEIIRTELSSSTSPLVTKNDFNGLEQKVANLEGAMNSHFRNNLIGLFFALVTIIATNVIAYYNFSSQINGVRTTVTPQSLPSPQKSK